MSLSTVEREDRQLALAHAVQLAATGRTDPADTVSYAEDFLGFLRADDAPADPRPRCPVCQHAEHASPCGALRTDDQPCMCGTMTRSVRA